TVCVVGKMRDLILQLSKSSIYSTKPGIALKSIWDVADDIESGRLCQILKQYQSQAAPLHAIYPHRQHVAPRVKVFIEFLIKNIREPDIYAKSPS
ncbi:LysR substrate-binding domain-containing protein, partial [Klebsiella quasipneumoniae subsp. similipneumoniae]